MATDRDASTSPMPECTGELFSVPTPRTAPHPFDNPSADVVIRSCDLVEFRVRSHILIEASPVLQTMLAQTPPPPQRPWLRKQTTETSSPVLELSEDSQTIETLLRICYPIVHPESYASPGEVESALRAAMKYEMELPTKVLADYAYVESTIVPDYPPQAWAIACRLGLEDLARHAAQESLRSSYINFTGLGSMEGITAGQYYRLMEYRRNHGNVDEDFLLLKPALSSEEQDDVGAPLGSPPSPPSFPDMPGANLICRSSDGVEFRVRKDLLSDASSELSQTIQAAERAHDAATTAGLSSSDEDEDEDVPAMPRVVFREKAAVLAQLFSFCRLNGDFQLPFQDLHVLADVMVVARKYNAHGLYELAQLRLSSLASTSPLQTYLTTVTRGLDDCARAAARKAIDLPIETTYLEELEQCPALAYHRLLSYCDACQNVAVRILRYAYRSRPVRRQTVEVAPGDNTPRPPTPPSTSPTRLSSLSNETRIPSGDLLFLRPKYFRSGSSWLAAYVASICEGASSRPGTAVKKEKMLFADATTTGNAWCSQCQLLASDLLNLGSDLRSIPDEVRKVVLAI